MPYSTKVMHALKAVLEANAVKPWFYFFVGTTK